ncbi:RNA dependent RNA polymerase-domain-containing protein, partial [Thamnocephalis sphaerospora]
PEYCVRVRKVVITPTKMYVLDPVVELSNAILRNFNLHADRLLRVQFLDESFYGIQGDERSTQLLNQLFTILLRGIRIGGRFYEFLAFSSSQLREFGCWFIAPEEGANGITAEQVRTWLGDFSDIDIIGKFAARMGQRFSSTHAVLELRNEDFKETPECIATLTNTTYSDGVGRMSCGVARHVQQALELPEMPSAVQFRLGGCKGVFTLHRPLLGECVEYRDSQHKFKSPHRILEVICTSSYTVGSLNRQIIMLLLALGISDTVILGRMEEAIGRLDRALENRESARYELLRSVDEYKVVPRLLAMIQAGLMERNDLYVANMLRVFRACRMREIKKKAKIAIDESVMLIGVMDELGVLGPNEIFVRFDDPAREEPRVVTGRCAVTRNPCLHPGDIRVLDAVDKPQLHYLKNVIVFNQKSDRSIPNMCAGGDLDGDIYTCIWDAKLVPETMYEPMDYTAPKPNRKPNVSVEDVKKFFVNYIVNNNLGIIDNAHLAWADQLKDGVRNGKCIKLAELHSLAVDFPKTGVPARMERRLRPRSYPHFMEKPDKAMYKSDSVVGKIYDRATECKFEPITTVELDEWLLEDGHELYHDEARDLKRQYDEAILSVMSQFGIASEWEVVSGWIIQYNSLLNKRDFHLREQVMNLVDGIVRKFRKSFEEEFVEQHEESSDPNNPTFTPAVNVRLEDLAARGPANTRPITQPSTAPTFSPEDREAMRRKASAWYYVAYAQEEREAEGAHGDMFSFPWIMHDHLCEIAKIRREAENSATFNVLYAADGAAPRDDC